MKKKNLVAAALATGLVLTASIGSAFAYFTTYESAAGGYTIHCGDEERMREEFQDWTKHVVITSDENSAYDMFIRAKAFCGSEYTLTYSSDSSWSLAEDGYYYYNKAISAGEDTAGLDVKIGGVPATEDPASFNVIVIYESTPALYDSVTNTYYADWNGDVKRGGDN